ncbi:DUF6731 family protein [Hespellia stercorisuis]|uniref:Uncharacterized protein n=1 Tax=Hespellia stercorisuis DSM 15480 TaxID=1121950 RepID=A0A1M6RF24_9FIRM|nr:DUF6731 family protein [Hespellia stercorisuis]SHK31059.1 hypothetical protein SAMN02745243_02675 [Hespellia stercorisuis DSM 15480]
MAEKKRIGIKYQYYQICTFDGDEYTEKLYDLLGWMDRVSKLSRGETVHEVSGIEGRIENIIPVYDDMFYGLNFMRLDVISNTYILERESKARHIDLSDDEYIGKNTVVLYDEKRSVAMVQCNRGSYGVHALQNYINSFNSPNELCYFRPIHDELRLDDLNDRETLKLDVRFANTRNFKPINSRFFEQVIDAYNQIECYTAHIECGLGYTKGSVLNKETIYDIASDIRNPQNDGTVSSAKLTLTDDQKSSVYDLFENICYDKIDFTIPARGELRFEDMAQKMAVKFYESGTRRKIGELLQ